jgi:hypothetical protein
VCVERERGRERYKNLLTSTTPKEFLRTPTIMGRDIGFLQLGKQTVIDHLQDTCYKRSLETSVRTGELNTLYRSKLHGNFVELPSHNNPPKKKNNEEEGHNLL